MTDAIDHAGSDESSAITEGCRDERGDVPVVLAPSTIEAAAAEVRALLGARWLAEFYRIQVLPLRTRSVRVHAAARGESVEPHHTLLGIELKIGRHRQHCPDLATARYLAVWARAGCTDVAIPYDITQISHFADELESAWHQMWLLAGYTTACRSASFQTRVRSLLIHDLRREVNDSGAGPAIPLFNQNTKQRPPSIQHFD